MYITGLILLLITIILSPRLAAIPQDIQWSSLLSALSSISILCIFYAISKKSPILINKKISYLALALLGWTIFSLIISLLIPSPHTRYLAVMLRGVSLTSVYIGIFIAAVAISRYDRNSILWILLAFFIGTGWLSAAAVQEYLIHYKVDKHWRVFAYSTPDYLACYVVMALPVMIAFIIGMTKESRLWILIALLATLDIASAFVTGSRFAVISIAAGLITLLCLLARNFMQSKQKISIKPGVIAASIVVFILILATVGHPLLVRFQTSQANSGQFRYYTWLGSLHMVKDNIVAGTGPGTYLYRYPRYAITGFTRAAHDTYLQVADESGLPACILYIGLIIAIPIFGIRTFFKPAASPQPDDNNSLVSHPILSAIGPILPPDRNRILLAGLIAGFVACSLQNLIDSDNFVFNIGFMFWCIGGLIVGLSIHIQEGDIKTGQREAASKHSVWKKALVGIAGVILVIINFSNFIAESCAAQAKLSLAGPNPDITAAESFYDNAETFAPFEGSYLSDRAYKISFGRQQDFKTAITSLKEALQLTPDSTTYRRLVEAYILSNDNANAVKTCRDGLKQDPNNLVLWLKLASLLPQQEALGCYRKINEISNSPVGTIRALGEVTEARFAIADSALGDEAFNRKDNNSALSYYSKACRTLESYLSENGTLFPMRLAMSNGTPDPESDKQMAELYSHAMQGMRSIDKSNGELEEKEAYNNIRFAKLVGDSYKQVNNNSEAINAYHNAKTLIDKLPLNIKNGLHKGDIVSLDTDIDNQIKALQ